MKKFIVFFIVFATVGSLSAQKSYRFESQFHAGMLEGQRGTALQLLSINGISKGQWFTGVGTGFDWYHLRSIPLFLSVNKRFYKGDRGFLAALDGGLNFPWGRERDLIQNGLIEDKFKPALYWTGGLGYRISMKNKKDAFMILVGYSFKHIKEEQVKPTICGFVSCNISEYYNYKLSRMSFRLSWVF